MSFKDCSILKVDGTYLTWIVLAEYFLEDCIQMTNFVPPPKDKKKKDKDKDEDGEEDDVSELQKEFSLWANCYKAENGFQ